VEFTLDASAAAVSHRRMTYPVLETERLILRAPEMTDFEPLCELMADEETTRFIGGTQSPPIAWRALCTIIGHWQVRGYGFFSVFERETGEWIGRVGPWYPHGWPQPEIGWSMNRSTWRKGYATEAAAACMDHVVDDLGWDSIIHLIDADNVGSQGVARKLGSTNSGRQVEVAGFGMMADVWGQSADEWRAFRKR
jgi:RimJ/RimL family protein N-acetyltransferase